LRNDDCKHDDCTPSARGAFDAGDDDVVSVQVSDFHVYLA
jgi:hypothetical protein